MKLSKFIFFLVLLVSGYQGFSQNISFNFNLENAKETITILKSKNPTEAQLNAFVKLPGTQAVIRKIKANDSLAYEAIRDATNGIFKKETSNFQYKSISKNLDKWESFIELVNSKQDSIKVDLQKSFAPYLDKNKSYNFNVFMLMGGYSAGFAFEDNANAFYIVLHHYQFDLGAVAIVCKHELFHNIQAIYYTPNKLTEKLNKINKGYANSQTLLNYVFMEGSASYMEEYNPLKSKNMPYYKEMRDHIAVNEYRESSLNLLFNTIVLDAFHKPEKVDLESAYELLFDWNWNNPAYYVGEKMTHALLEFRGKEALMDYMKRDAVYFFEDYIDLAKKNKDKFPIQFTSDFEKMIKEIKLQIESN